MPDRVGGALVTGGAQGIGRAIARRLAARGSVVFIGDLDVAAAAKTAAELRIEGGEVHALDLDVKGEALLEVMVNNAGRAFSTPLLEVTPEQFDSLMAVNLRGVFFGVQAAAQVMCQRRRGSIVNLASTSAFTASTSPMVPYDTSKGAVRMLTLAAARELAPFGVRVNAVAPGTIDTDLTRSLLTEPGALEEQAADLIPLGRLGVPDDAAAAVDYLTSEAASYVTGHVLVVDGGWLT